MLPVIIICLIILGIEFITGIIANGLMIIVNCSEWIRSRKLTCCDMILTSLGISRFFLQWTMFINNILFALSPVMNGLCNIRRNLYIFWMYLNILSLWFATWLSVFYCVKIANFSQPLFLWLKRRISGLVPLLLMGSWLVSLVTCLPFVNFIERNIFVVPAVLLITSLWRHTKRMGKNTNISRDTITEAHWEITVFYNSD
ncbi:taste receptor type 2 member 41-like [Malaclemys terrapin pileata]|uniref:taste receptor type 2 member 41-like n=1 Tax=Malaclemys terrapin pileata TaxID=2991368 RepID=UPI0023A7FD15|nr:taste receptor type 2 member 41-like [Malaclemys terrapin pileata]